MRLAAPSIFLLVAALWPAVAVDLAELVPGETAAKLRAGEEVRRVFRDRDGLALMPALPMRQRESGRVDALAPTVGVELMALYRPPALPVDRLAVYNALRSVSRLKGIEYFSATRGRMRIFFEDAAFVRDADSPERVADPVATDVPAGTVSERRFAYFDDSSLGTYIAEVEYETSPLYMTTRFANARDIRKMLIPFVDPGGLASFVALVPLDDAILFYGFSCVRAPNLFGIVERKGESSFTNRMVALYAWFRATYEAAR